MIKKEIPTAEELSALQLEIEKFKSAFDSVELENIGRVVQPEEGAPAVAGSTRKK